MQSTIGLVCVCQISNVLVLYFYLWNFQRSGSEGRFCLLAARTNECEKNYLDKCLVIT